METPQRSDSNASSSQGINNNGAERRSPVRTPSDEDFDLTPNKRKSNIHSRLYCSPTISSSHRTLDKETDFYIPIDVQPLFRTRGQDPKFLVSGIPHLVDKRRSSFSAAASSAAAVAAAAAAYEHNRDFYRPQISEDHRHSSPDSSIRNASHFLKPTVSAAQKQQRKSTPEKNPIHQKSFLAGTRPKEPVAPVVSPPVSVSRASKDAASKLFLPTAASIRNRYTPVEKEPAMRKVPGSKAVLDVPSKLFSPTNASIQGRYASPPAPKRPSGLPVRRPSTARRNEMATRNVLENMASNDLLLRSRSAPARSSAPPALPGRGDRSPSTKREQTRPSGGSVSTSPNASSSTAQNRREGAGLGRGAKSVKGGEAAAAIAALQATPPLSPAVSGSTNSELDSESEPLVVAERSVARAVSGAAEVGAGVESTAISTTAHQGSGYAASAADILDASDRELEYICDGSSVADADTQTGDDQIGGLLPFSSAQEFLADEAVSADEGWAHPRGLISVSCQTNSAFFEVTSGSVRLLGVTLPGTRRRAPPSAALPHAPASHQRYSTPVVSILECDDLLIRG